MDGPVLALEQAAGFTRAVVYSRQGRPLAAARDDIRRLSRGPGLSTYDPEEIWQMVQRHGGTVTCLPGGCYDYYIAHDYASILLVAWPNLRRQYQKDLWL